MITVITSDHLIGLAPVGPGQREGYQASREAEHSASRRVSVRASATNAWNQNWNSSNPGNQLCLMGGNRHNNSRNLGGCYANKSDAAAVFFARML